ncbi:hypothetical protein DVK02_01505 [Halobellus sp. Atlit-31R]|nr:hypothetical protein DVK02_01505 [Halobellus sp. Atlit-31R]
MSTTRPRLAAATAGTELDSEDEGGDTEWAEYDVDDRTVDLTRLQGANATVSVTQNGSAVADAAVSVGEDRVGTTDADGTVTVSVPDEGSELEVRITRGDAETKLTVDLDAPS